MYLKKLKYWSHNIHTFSIQTSNKQCTRGSWLFVYFILLHTYFPITFHKGTCFRSAAPAERGGERTSTREPARGDARPVTPALPVNVSGRGRVRREPRLFPLTYTYFYTLTFKYTYHGSLYRRRSASALFMESLTSGLPRDTCEGWSMAVCRRSL